MVNRRQALLGIGVAVISSTAPAASAIAELLDPVSSQAPAASPQTASNEAVDERLRKELALMASRENSEEGVPVFLGCVNLVPEKTSSKMPPVHLTRFNSAVAAEFRQNAEAWERIRPDAKAKDVARLIEVLAVRDFSSAGTEMAS